jgi:hypothetical protein
MAYSKAKLNINENHTNLIKDTLCHDKDQKRVPMEALPITVRNYWHFKTKEYNRDYRTELWEEMSNEYTNVLRNWKKEISCDRYTTMLGVILKWIFCFLRTTLLHKLNLVVRISLVTAVTRTRCSMQGKGWDHSRVLWNFKPDKILLTLCSNQLRSHEAADGESLTESL